MCPTKSLSFLFFIMPLLGCLTFWFAVGIWMVPLIVFVCKAKNSEHRVAKVTLRDGRNKQETEIEAKATAEVTEKVTERKSTKLEGVVKEKLTEAPVIPNACTKKEFNNQTITKFVHERPNKYSLVGALGSDASNSSDMSTDDTLMIQPIRVGLCGRTKAVIDGEEPVQFSQPRANFSSSSEFSYFNYEASKRDIKEQLQRLHKLNKPAALRAAADLCETIISPARSHKNSQTILVRGEKRMEAELYGNDEDLLTAIES